ncbi:sugar-binding transcriptional regulator [Ammoniphilus sp. 3BR4]|uniref:sugar-binding transcriptional regulator n=1 Tax=Ammoniphilus sp. 3BR4 TaxID=3158265 RepID=UPI003467CC61
MAYSDDSRILLKIAHLYYEEGATQAEIANVLGVSRPLISKYLAKAREMGLVEIIIHDELVKPHTDLESRLERKFQLREVVIVSESGTNAANRNLGIAASNYLLRVVKENQIIGVSSGTTLHEVSSAMSKGHISSLTIIPLVGGVGDERMDIHANQIAALMADRLGAEYKLLHAPVVVDSPEAKEIFLRQKLIADIFTVAAQCDIAVVGIGGSPEHSTMVKSFFGNDYERELAEAGVVGDICNIFINSSGRACEISWNSRVIAISLDSLKNIPLVIGVAQGSEKVEAIRAALTGRLVNVLVTDEVTAEYLLQDE